MCVSSEIPINRHRDPHDRRRRPHVEQLTVAYAHADRNKAYETLFIGHVTYLRPGIHVEARNTKSNPTPTVIHQLIARNLILCSECSVRILYDSFHFERKTLSTCVRRTRLNKCVCRIAYAFKRMTCSRSNSSSTPGIVNVH